MSEPPSASAPHTRPRGCGFVAVVVAAVRVNSCEPRCVGQILGWTDKSFSLVRELCLAMKSEGGGVVVILSERDKSEIESEVCLFVCPHPTYIGVQCVPVVLVHLTNTVADQLFGAFVVVGFSSTNNSL